MEVPSIRPYDLQHIFIIQTITNSFLDNTLLKFWSGIIRTRSSNCLIYVKLGNYSRAFCKRRYVRYENVTCLANTQAEGGTVVCTPGKAGKNRSQPDDPKEMLGGHF